jgi:hypothetical protein
MSKMIAIALALVMMTSVFGDEKVASQITAMPAGTKIELRLSNKQTVRGARGQLSNTGFTFIDTRTGERQMSFDEVVSVKRLKSHTIRNVLIVVGLGVAALGITVGVILRCGPLGCGK